MKAQIRDRKEFAVGAIFLALGCAVVAHAQSYEMGTATQMGPGYFPTLLGIVLLALGVTAMVNGVRAARPTRIGSWPLVQLAFIEAGILAFAALISTLGLGIAVIALVLLSCYERLLRRPIEVAVICVVLIVMTAAIFIYGIQLPIQLWGDLGAAFSF